MIRQAIPIATASFAHCPSTRQNGSKKRKSQVTKRLREGILLPAPIAGVGRIAEQWAPLVRKENDGVRGEGGPEPRSSVIMIRAGDEIIRAQETPGSRVRWAPIRASRASGRSLLLMDGRELRPRRERADVTGVHPIRRPVNARHTSGARFSEDPPIDAAGNKKTPGGARYKSSR